MKHLFKKFEILRSSAGIKPMVFFQRIAVMKRGLEGRPLSFLLIKNQSRKLTNIKTFRIL